MRSLLALLAIAPALACGPRAALDGPSPAAGRATSFRPLGATLVQAISAGQRPRAEAKPISPIALTASDGSGLALVALEVAAVVDGPIAMTELRLTFHNPEPRRREGRFTITLPPDAAVSRFAMKNADWLEAEVVPRQEARRAYESFLKQRVDPALLEKDAGNSFSARVFPIEASADKELIIGYSHTISGGDGRRVALAGLPAVGALRWSITIDGVTQRGAATDRAPTDLMLAADADGPAAVQAGEAFVARVVPPVPALADPLGATTILIDTSASRSSLLRRQADVVRALCEGVAGRDPGAPIAIVAFDQEAEVIARGPAARVATGLADKLAARGGMGASDLGVALRAAGGAERVVLVSDGIATLGERDAGALARRIAAAGIGRLDAITLGALADRDRLAALVEAGARTGAIVDGEEPGALAALERARTGALAVTVAGASAVWPPVVRGAGAGESVIIAGRRAPDDAPLAITFGAGAAARTVRVDVRPAPAPLVARAAARAELTELDRTLAAAEDDRARAATRAAIERLGVTHRLVTAETSLLVLETDADYARFCIPRTGRADILTIRDDAVAVIDRSPGGPPSLDPCKPPPADHRTFAEVLGTAAGTQGDSLGVAFSGTTTAESTFVVDGEPVIETEGVQEVIEIEGRAPTIDQTSTTQGITIDQDYLRNIPVPGRTFGAAAPLIDTHSTAIGQVRSSPRTEEVAVVNQAQPARAPLPSYEGRLLTVMTALAQRQPRRALAEALDWYLAEPTDLAAMVALGEALEGSGALALAARAYGSILDRFPGRVELVRFTGERLERLGPAARARAADVYAQAIADRPDHASGYRLLAMTQLADRQYARATATLEDGLARAQRDSIGALYRGDLGLVGAAWAAARPHEREAIARRLARSGATIADQPSLRFVLSWETDTNDVDLHVRDRHGFEAYYEARVMPSGGRLLDDVTTGYGPEEFVIEGQPTAGPYRISVKYFERGVMGLGLGTVQVVRHDGRGQVTVEARPFVLQTDDAVIDLGEVR